MSDWLFEWRAPMWLWALLLLLWLLPLNRLRAASQLKAYADAKLWPWLQPKRSKRTGFWRATHWLALGFVALVIALAGPRFYSAAEATENRAGVDVLLALDLSHSMLADSGQGQSRIDLAKVLAQSLVAELSPQDRVGLMAFAGSAHIVSPVAYDRSLWLQDLQRLQVNDLPLKGSWLERALVVGAEHLNAVSFSQERPKILLFLSDGAPPFVHPVELPAELKNLPLPDWLASQYFSILALGIGGQKPALVPLEQGGSEPLRDAGVPVYSTLQSDSLRQLSARARSGNYWHASVDKSLIEEVAAAIEQRRHLQEVKVSQRQWQDYALYFVFIAMMSFLMAFYAPRQWLGRAALFVASVFVLLSLHPVVSYADESVQQQAYAAYKQGDYAQSLSDYEQLAQAKPYAAWMGAGASAYKAEDYQAAVGYFQQAAWVALGDNERAHALFNLGNAYYHANSAEFAVQAYEQALSYRNPYPEAEHNLEIAKRRQKQDSASVAADNDDAQGRSEQKGNDQEGAFYGGQKPEGSESDEQGFGADGDQPEGNRQGEKPPLPEELLQTYYQLNQDRVSPQGHNALGGLSAVDSLNAQQLEQAKRFAAEVDKLDAQQVRLLKRLFEAEAGFHAEQKAPSAIPGVQPW